MKFSDRQVDILCKFFDSDYDGVNTYLDEDDFDSVIYKFLKYVKENELLSAVEASGLIYEFFRQEMNIEPVDRMSRLYCGAYSYHDIENNHIILPKNIKQIGGCAFSHPKFEIHSVQIAGDVEFIGDNIFDCSFRKPIKTTVIFDNWDDDIIVSYSAFAGVGLDSNIMIAKNDNYENFANMLFKTIKGFEYYEFLSDRLSKYYVVYKKVHMV